MGINLNCDMGESFGLYSFGSDTAIMPLVTQANIACGYHASDPNHMKSTVALAKKHSVQVGAHVSLPDLAGFGRREMRINREEMFNIILYQIGALDAFLKHAGLKLSHIKPHGALYGMAARIEDIALAVADAALLYDVPILGLPGTLHEEVYTRCGAEFQAEFFADLDYNDEGGLIITRDHEAVDPERASARAVQVIEEGTLTTIGGKTLPAHAETICVHSDTPNAVEIARAVKDALVQIKNKKPAG